VIFLAVNYHYVSEEERPDARAIFATPVARLVAQVELLARDFELVSRDELVRAVLGGSALPERACLITFDDGLREQFEVALPALARLGAPALFLVPGLPLAEGRALHVHKTHHVREALDEGELGQRVRERLGAAAPEVADEDALAAYRYDTPKAARLKYLLNHVLPESARERLIDELFRELVPDEAAFVRDLYMTREQVRELERRHRALGAHSYSHRPLALLERGAARGDLDRSARLLEELAGARPRVLSYPHGSAAAVSHDVARAAAAAGFTAGFTMERAFNRTLDKPLLLARVDTNDAPGGKRPLIEVEGERVAARDGMSAARARYIQEGG
jgi:peptidoglycan/xylan/chitin deacetylase (PgdA/CDA1 family)